MLLYIPDPKKVYSLAYQKLDLLLLLLYCCLTAYFLLRSLSISTSFSSLFIMIGGSGEKHLLKVVAKHADRYNHPCGSVKLLKRMISKLKEH
jgi:hypothetical protein